MENIKTMEIRIPNGPSSEQVFKAKDDTEMVTVLAKAQANATRKIRSQQKEISHLQGLLTEALAQMITENITSKKQNEDS